MNAWELRKALNWQTIMKDDRLRRTTSNFISYLCHIHCTPATPNPQFHQIVCAQVPRPLELLCQQWGMYILHYLTHRLLNLVNSFFPCSPFFRKSTLITTRTVASPRALVARSVSPIKYRFRANHGLHFCLSLFTVDWAPPHGHLVSPSLQSPCPWHPVVVLNVCRMYMAEGAHARRSPMVCYGFDSVGVPVSLSLLKCLLKGKNAVSESWRAADAKSTTIVLSLEVRAEVSHPAEPQTLVPTQGRPVRSPSSRPRPSQALRTLPRQDLQIFQRRQ